MTTRQIRVAVIGLGWVALERHIPNLLRHPQVKLVGVVDRKPQHAEEVARRLRIPRWAASDNGAVEWLRDVDAVTIATPPASHFTLTKAMLQAGKDVLLEKPMAMCVEEGRELAALAQSSGRLLAMVHNFQFARSLQKLQGHVQGGVLGELRAVLAVQFSNPSRRLPRWYEELPLGLFYDESPHLLYLMRRFAPEEPRIISADIVAAQSGQQTPSQVTVRASAGPLALHLYANFEAPVSEWYFMLLGSERLAAADLFRDILVVVRNDRRHRAGDVLRTTRDVVGGHLWGLLTSGSRFALGRLPYGNDGVMQRFIQAVQTRQPPEGMSVTDGLRVLELQHSIIRYGMSH